MSSDTTPARVNLVVSPAVATRLFGADPLTLRAGTAGKWIRFSSIGFTRSTAPARNVIGIIPGSDPALRGEYVALGAHNDHLGIRFAGPLDHDSLRAYNIMANRIVEARTHATPGTPGGGLTAAERASIHVNVDSLHRIRAARRDSIYNGADDDGSGSVGALEIAEAFAKSGVKPRRSLIFVWHTGEEAGLLGSRYFADNPTVPRDSIVAQLNMDMIGRGGAFDFVGGGAPYLQLVGSRRLSTELHETREQLRLTPDNILHVVQTGLAVAQRPPLEPVVVPRRNRDGNAIQVRASSGRPATVSAMASGGWAWMTPLTSGRWR